jgi:undecaprenyl-diphosphatase
VVLLGWSRLYLGMHHLSDVAVGVLNGVAAAVLGWNYLRRSGRFRQPPDPLDATPAATDPVADGFTHG